MTDARTALIVHRIRTWQVNRKIVAWYTSADDAGRLLVDHGDEIAAYLASEPVADEEVRKLVDDTRHTLKEGAFPGSKWINSLCDTIDRLSRDLASAKAEIARKDALLKEALIELKHSTVFISTREKMHQTGRELHAELIADIDASLAPKEDRT